MEAALNVQGIFKLSDLANLDDIQCRAMATQLQNLEYSTGNVQENAAKTEVRKPLLVIDRSLVRALAISARDWVQRDESTVKEDRDEVWTWMWSAIQASIRREPLSLTFFRIVRASFVEVAQ